MKKIAITANSTKDIGYVYTKKLVEYLSGKACLYMEKSLSVLGLDVNYVEYEELFCKADIMIVLGGDGTILQIASSCAKHGIPVMGINLGRVGFMTEIEIENMNTAADALLSENYSIENRMMLKLEIVKNGQINVAHALNDAVVSRSSNAKLVNIELYADEELVTQYVADGLIIATPTGSTGYSISAGGPVVDPNMDLFIATPICPHMLGARSAVIPPHKKIVIRPHKDYRDNEAVVSCDGDISGYISIGDEVRITKSKYQFKIIKTGGHSFYETLVNKLGNENTQVLLRNKE